MRHFSSVNSMLSVYETYYKSSRKTQYLERSIVYKQINILETSLLAEGKIHLCSTMIWWYFHRYFKAGSIFAHFLISDHWILVPWAQNQIATRLVKRWRMGESSRFWVGIRGGCQVIMRKAWPLTIVSNAFWECHAPCTVKNSSVDFGKSMRFVALQKTKLFIPTQISILFFRGNQMSLTPHFYIDSIYIYYWTSSRPQYSWNTGR